MVFTYNGKSLKKSKEFLKNARAYLRKGRYARGMMMMMMINFISVSGLPAGHVRPTNRGH